MFNVGSVRVKSRRVGDFVFDATLGETHESTLNITENPIETGESISDHAFLSPKPVVISGIMVSYDPPKGVGDLLGGAFSFIREFPLPAPVRGLTNQTLQYVVRVLPTATQAAGSSRMIAPYLPNFGASGNDSSPSMERIGRAYADLVALQQSGELLEIVTGARLYKSMMLNNVTMIQTNDGAGEFTLALREVFVVSTAQEGGLVLPQNTQGRTGDQSANAQNHGRTQPQSVIHRAGEGRFW